MDLWYPPTRADAPALLYVIFVMGIAIFTLLLLKRQSLLRAAPLVSFLLLFVTWLPLVLYNAVLLTGMASGSIEVPFQDLSKSLGMMLMQFAHFLHLVITFIFFPSFLSSLKYLKNEG